MFVICYRTGDGETHYADTDDTEKWRMEHADMQIDHIFDKSSCLIWSRTMEMTRFYQQCAAYGFTHDDYMCTVRGQKGNRLSFVGFLPGNRKYKCLLRDMDDGRLIKADAGYVRKRMEAK